MEEDETELRIVIRGLLTSRTTVLTSTCLFRDFNEEEGRDFPYRKLGFNTFVDYLKSIPTVCRLIPSNSYDPEVHPIASVKSKHIDELISKQKAPSKRSSRAGRGWRGRGGRGPPIRASYTGYTLRPPSQRRPIAADPPLPRPTVEYPPALPVSKGVYVSQLESEFQNSCGKDVYGVQRGSNVLEHTKDMFKVENDRVHPNMSYKFDTKEYYQSKHNVNASNYREKDGQDMYNDNFDSQAYCNSRQSGDKNIYSDNHSQVVSNGIPAGAEEDIDEEYYDDELDGPEDDSFWQNDEEYISKYTIERFSKLEEKEENNNKTSSTENNDESEDIEDHEYHFSKKMIANFRFILDKNPNGVWTSELVQKYKENFHIDLDLQSLGYTSAIYMAVHLPKVFSYERVMTHDWKLYDARTHKKPSPSQENPEVLEEGVPRGIVENVHALVRDSGSLGIKSTYLLDKYQMKYKKSLDIKTLGFSNLDELLVQLEKQGLFTLRKMDGYYHIQKKHEIIPLQSKRTSEGSAPAVINPEEAVSIHIPDYVCRLGTKIELQALPEINMDAGPMDPLIDMAIKVGEVISPSEFYVILDSKFNDLECLMEDLKNLYVQEEKKFRIPLPYIAKGLYCAVQYQGEGDWHRVQTVGFESDNKMKIEYIDYGTPETVKCSDLRFLHTSFSAMPAQAIRAKLCNIRPKNHPKKWSTRAKHEFLNVVMEKRLIAHVYKISTENSKEQMQLDMILYDTTQSTTNPVVINEYLVEKGFAAYENDCEASSGDEAKPESDSMPSDRHVTASSPLCSTSERTNLCNMESPPSTSRQPPPGFESQQKPVLGYSPSEANSWANLVKSWAQPAISQLGYGTARNDYAFNAVQPNQNQYPTSNNVQGSHQQSLGNNWWQSFLMSNLLYQHNAAYAPYISQQIAAMQAGYYNNSNVPQNVSFQQPSLPPLPLVINNVSYSQSQYSLPYPLASQFQQAANNQTSSSSNVRPQSSQESSVQTRAVAEKVSVLSPPPAYEDVVRQVPRSFNMDQLNDVLSSTGLGEKVISNTNTNRPKTPLSPVSAEITDVFNRSRHDSGTSQCSHISEKLYETVQDDLTPDISRHNDGNTRLSDRGVFNISNENVSLDTIESTSEVARDSNTVTSGHKVTPVSWEDLDLDDTPLTLEDLLPCKNNEYKSSIESKTHMTHKEEGDFVGVELPVTGNWKDIFNPDIKTTHVRPTESRVTEEKRPMPDIKKGLLVQPVVGLSKEPFHLIIVNKEPAVVAKEFYPLLTSHQYSTIEKLADTRSMSFPMINKRDHQELFEELKKVQFSEAIKKSLLRLNQIKISYLADVPNVLVMLRFSDKGVLEALREILKYFDQS